MKYVKILFFSTLAGLGCNKTSRIEDMSSVRRISSLENYTTMNPAFLYNYLAEEADAVVYVTSQGGLQNQDFNEPRVDAVFKPGRIDYTLPSVINKYPLDSFSRVTYRPVDPKAPAMKALFGNRAYFELNYHNEGKDYSFTYTLPVPAKLKMPEQELSTFFEGKEVVWEPAPKVAPRQPIQPTPTTTLHRDNNYMLISIAYDPDSPANTTRRPSGGVNRTSYRNILLNDEKGSYTITADDLKNFPSGVHLDISMYRGNVGQSYELNSKKKFAVGSYTVLSYGTKKA